METLSENRPRKLTRNLQSLLALQKTNLTPVEYESFASHVDNLVGEMTGTLRAEPAGIPRARLIHAMIEKEMANIGALKPTCSAGCAACCHFQVEISADEAEILAHIVRTGKIAVDQTQLRERSTRGRESAEWSKGFVPTNRCLFLGATNKCLIYEDRPSACRRLVVTSPPAACGAPEGKPQPIAIPMVEIILSGAMNIPGTEFGHMAKMVTQVMGEEISAPGISHRNEPIATAETN